MSYTITARLPRMAGMSPCPLMAMLPLLLLGFTPSAWGPHYYHRSRHATAWLRRAGKQWAVYMQRVSEISVRIPEIGS